MPPARNHEVTVRRPLANNAPSRSKARRGDERLSRVEARAKIQADRSAFRCKNGMAGSLTRDSLYKGHGGQGASILPPTCAIHHLSSLRPVNYYKIPLFAINPKFSRKVQLGTAS